MTPQKLAIQFIVHNWKGVLIALLSLVVMGKMRYDYKQMQAAYEASEQSLQAQLRLTHVQEDGRGRYELKVPPLIPRGDSEPTALRLGRTEGDNGTDNHTKITTGTGGV